MVINLVIAVLQQIVLEQVVILGGVVIMMIVALVLIMKNKMTIWMARFVGMIVESVSVQIP